MKENPIVPSKIIYCTCGFLLDIQTDGEHKTWYEFIVEC